MRDATDRVFSPPCVWASLAIAPRMLWRPTRRGTWARVKPARRAIEQAAGSLENSH